MNLSDFHIHTSYSDGKHTPEEIVIKAIEIGMTDIGFSDHSYTPFDESYCIKKNDISSYIDEIITLKEKYKNDIKIHLGIEQDYYSDINKSQFDYVIGSVHYIRINDEYIPIDEDAETLIKAANKYFCGNIYCIAELYYKTLADVINKTDADIIGHFDLIAKFNENNILFDENDKRYITAYKLAADRLLKSNKIFEINTGAISRGYKTAPYPSLDIYNYLKENGAKFILSSDSHSKDTLCYGFEKYIGLM